MPDFLVGKKSGNNRDYRNGGRDGRAGLKAAAGAGGDARGEQTVFKFTDRRGGMGTKPGQADSTSLPRKQQTSEISHTDKVKASEREQINLEPVPKSGLRVGHLRMPTPQDFVKASGATNADTTRGGHTGRGRGGRGRGRGGRGPR